jgi:hypothetical protein
MRGNLGFAGGPAPLAWKAHREWRRESGENLSRDGCASFARWPVVSWLHRPVLGTRSVAGTRTRGPGSAAYPTPRGHADEAGLHGSVEPIDPMTLGNMRQLGVRSLAVTCDLCHHQAVLSAAPWRDDIPVPTFGPRMVCRPMAAPVSKMTIKSDEYLARAIVCEQRAKEAIDLALRQQWEELATHWHFMANQAARLLSGEKSRDDTG